MAKRRITQTTPCVNGTLIPIIVPQLYLCPYISPFLRYSETLVENRQFEHTPPLFGALVGVTSLGAISSDFE